MILDNLLTFTGTSNGATGGITSGANTDSPTAGTQPASNIIDLGVISGVPPSSRGAGARDIGIGDDPAMKISVIVTTAMVGGTSLGFNIQGAPDNGSGLPGTFTTMFTSPITTLASGNLAQGIQLANIDMPRVLPGQPLPRFIQMNFISAGTFTGGAVEAQIVLNLDQQIPGAAGVYSGYAAGINVAN